jgi:hypothetical protein
LFLSFNLVHILLIAIYFIWDHFWVFFFFAISSFMDCFLSNLISILFIAIFFLTLCLEF